MTAAMPRPARTDDLPALVALDARCNPSPWSLAHFQAALNPPQHEIWLLERHNRPAAFIVWQNVAGEMELHLIATAPEQRRQGLAARLLAVMLERAAADAVSRILLEVRAGNAAAQALYRRYGFQQTAVRPRYYSDGEDALIMEKLC